MSFFLAPFLVPAWELKGVGNSFRREFHRLAGCSGPTLDAEDIAYQGIQGSGKTVQQVAQAIFDALVTNLKTRDTMLTRLIDLVLFSMSEEQAINRLSLVLRLTTVPRKHLEKLQSNAPQQKLFRDSEEVLALANELLTKHGLDAIRVRQEPTLSDDVPF